MIRVLTVGVWKKSIYKLRKLKPYIKTDKKIKKFDETEIDEFRFPQNKSPILIDYIDINKIVVSNKLLFGKQDIKYLIGYKDSKKLDLNANSVWNSLHIKKNWWKETVLLF